MIRVSIPRRLAQAPGRGSPISRLAHLSFALAYSVIALALALALPILVPAISVETGLMLGIFAFLLGALVHEVIARRRSEVRALRRMVALRRLTRDIQERLALIRDEMLHIQQAGAAAETAEEGRDPDDVVAEVKVLQSLVERLYGQRPPGAPSGASDERPPPAPRITDGLGAEEILDIVRDGLRRDRVDLYLQPIVSLPQRKRRYFECFARIRSEDGSLIVPEQYLEIAETAGQVDAIDNMLLFRSVQLVRRTQKRRYNVGFFCNVSRHSIADGAFFHDFVQFMADNADLAPNLFFEFAQADLATHDAAALGELDRLSDLGYRFSVDQVNDLNLNVTSLASRHFGFVKVDAASLLRKIRQEPPEVDVRDFKTLLDQAGIDLIVDRIEGERELIELLDYNIDYGQGVLFGEPRLAREA
ncbi:MAG: EAL domain-containing protein [Kiloniellales bacterium]